MDVGIEGNIFGRDFSRLGGLAGNCWFKMLSDDHIAELKLRIDKSRKVRSVEHNGCITER